MSDAPERIWAWQALTDKKWGEGYWYAEDVGLDGDDVVYIRADLYEALERELENTRDFVRSMKRNIKNYLKDK